MKLQQLEVQIRQGNPDGAMDMVRSELETKQNSRKRVKLEIVEMEQRKKWSATEINRLKEKEEQIEESLEAMEREESQQETGEFQYS